MAHVVELHPSPLATAPAAPAGNTRLQAFGRSVWKALERVGQLRAARQLELLARTHDQNNAPLARRLREAARNSLAG